MGLGGLMVRVLCSTSSGKFCKMQSLKDTLALGSLVYYAIEIVFKQCIFQKKIMSTRNNRDRTG